jgi:hypothetical protein
MRSLLVRLCLALTVVGCRRPAAVRRDPVASAVRDAGSTAAPPVLAPRGRAPKEHRATALACSPAVAKGGALYEPSPDGCGTSDPQCKADKECSRGKNGRCAPLTYEGACGNICYYDACYLDGDCGTGEVCTCGDGDPTHPHACVPGNCRIDADCGDAGYCSPTPQECGGVAGWFCHTTKDECVDDADCPSPRPCTYESKRGAWVCGRSPACM